MEMETLTSALSAAVDETTFELVCPGRPTNPHFHSWIRRTSRRRSRAAARGRRVPSAEFREFYLYLREKGRFVMYSAETIPDAALMSVVDALRCTLGEFIHPDTEMIGHAFPVNGSTHGRTTLRPGGLCDREDQSSLSGFASALVQAAAIMGVKEAVELLAGWKKGQPVHLRMCTVLSGLPLAAPLTPRPDIRIVPLPLSTAELPWLPISTRESSRDYLGLSLLTVQLSASPALFRPDSDPDTNEQIVHTSSADGIDFDQVCGALSLQTNNHVSLGVIWHENLDTAPFSFRKGNSTWRLDGGRIKPLHGRESHDYATGAVEIDPYYQDGAPLLLDEEELLRFVEATNQADRKLRVAVDRWCRSKRSEGGLEDSYIDLRIALEALYLKDFDDERSQEMRFRLPLFGAWHLARNLEERRSIRKTLRNAYDTASKVVHGGKVLNDQAGAGPFRTERAEFERAQDLCRCGILKLLREGPPKDWGDLVLGGVMSGS